MQEGSPVKIGVPKETYPDERRVALVPAAVSALTKAGYEVLIEKGAGIAAGYPDSEYEGKGASLIDDRKSIFSLAEIVAQVRGPGANPEHGNADIALLRSNQILIAMLDPLAATDEMQTLAKSGATVFGMELMPRISRAQSMDVLSSMASVAGYLAVLMAATKLPKFFPMFMTAAGTISPAHVFVLGAGVAGLQAIATAKRLGAVVQAYDVRPAVKEQVESLGGKFVEFDVGGGEGEGGYAKELTDEQKTKQAELMAGVIQAADVVITTAAVPGKKSPILIREDVVKGMKPGSVIVDLAAEKGGNVDLTKPGETVEVHGVSIIGTLNLPSHLPFHASQMYAKNIQTFLLHLGKEGSIELDLEDEITKGSLVAKGGEVVHTMVKDAIAKG